MCIYKMNKKRHWQKKLFHKKKLDDIYQLKRFTKIFLNLKSTTKKNKKANVRQVSYSKELF